jgi:dihydrofolate reductase
MIGETGGTTGVDDGFFARGFEGIGASVMGRNMYGPIRGGWDTPDAREWRGWWGPNPPYHHPVFVLTHHEHEPIEMEGGTTFHFVTDGIESALAQAFVAADGADVRLGGGGDVVRQYLRAGLVDELQVALVPVLLGGGERIFDDLGDVAERYETVEVVPGERATHFVLRRRP